MDFQTSKFCHTGGCVAVAANWPIPGQKSGIAVRDTKLDNSPVLVFTQAEWADFIAACKRGDYTFA